MLFIKNEGGKNHEKTDSVIASVLFGIFGVGYFSERTGKGG
jgi:hypothetical protein